MLVLTEKSIDTVSIRETLIETKETFLKVNMDCQLADFSFLGGNPFIEKIEYNSLKKVDMSFVNCLLNIKELYGQTCVLNFEIKNRNIKRLAGNWTKKFAIGTDCESLKDLGIGLCKNMPSLFNNIHEKQTIEQLEFAKSEISDFYDLPRLENIGFLGISHNPALSTFDNIDNVFPNLKTLKLEYIKNLTEYKSLGRMTQLETLIIYKCAGIENLDFCLNMKKLKDLRIVDTKINTKPDNKLREHFSNFDNIAFFGTGRSSMSTTA